MIVSFCNFANWQSHRHRRRRRACRFAEPSKKSKSISYITHCCILRVITYSFKIYFPSIRISTQIYYRCYFHTSCSFQLMYLDCYSVEVAHSKYNRYLFLLWLLFPCPQSYAHHSSFQIFCVLNFWMRYRFQPCHKICKINIRGPLY